ncbi:hypothetical protein DFH08DRAFT_281391 [Mycena albidolilacea]|uniref:Uncharacterized protein n=1 Tax=Mycena albidolilacea TaxID=1033008 RepID=A0AAD6ZSI3_9AGAR|nr:hypothetical protein DFH08DRAFT_281391 [Mycena albidolilacea]
MERGAVRGRRVRMLRFTVPLLGSIVRVYLDTCHSSHARRDGTKDGDTRCSCAGGCACAVQGVIEVHQDID